MITQQTIVRHFLLTFILPVIMASSGRLVAVELRFDNTIEYVHPDEVEMVQYCRKAGINYNLNNQTSNPGGGGIVRTKEGQVIVLYLPANNALTAEQLQPLSKATQLSSFNCPSWADNKVIDFFTHPGRFPKVTGLSIYGSKITDEGLAGLKNFPLIGSLNLESSSITDQGVLHLSKIPTFSFLRLNATRITDKGVSYLKDLPNLSFLELKTTQITDDGLEYLGRLPKLHTLYLDNTSITGSGLMHLAPLTQLRLLSLDNTRLNDRGLSELAEHPNLAKIEVLYLADTKITDAGCTVFEKLNNLRVLNLANTKITDQGVRHLKDMPRLYNLSLSSIVTNEGKKWLAENARFDSSLQAQLRQATQASQKNKPDQTLLAFQAGLEGADLIVFQLGQASRDEMAAEAARQQVLNMKADAIKPILDMAEKCSEQGHPLSQDNTFQFTFLNNASLVLRAVCTESMSTLADHFAKSPGKREVISRALDTGDALIPPLEVWLQHESPLVRVEALRLLARRATIRRLGPGVASPTTVKHNSMKLSVLGRERVYSLLADSDVNVQKAACTMVLAVEDDLSVKSTALVEAILREKNQTTLWSMEEALYFLAEQQPVDSKDLPVPINGFIDVLRKSDNATAQLLAIRHLGKLGGKSERAIDLLRTFQKGPDKQLATTAGHTLEQIHRCPITLMRATEIPVDVQALVFTLTTYDQEAIDRATEELASRGPSMLESLLTAARAEVGDNYPYNAAAVVARWNQDDVLPVLRPAFNWTNTTVRLFVIRSISQMKWNELPSVVKDSLEGADAKVRSSTRSSLSTLARNTSGQATQELARLIAVELKNPGLDWTLASSLTASLTSCYPSSSEVPSLLVDILKQDMQHASPAACNALSDIVLVHDHLAGKADDRNRIIEAILGMLQTTKNEFLKMRCIAALSRFGPDSREALPTLRQIQQEGSGNLAKSAASAINSIEQRSKQTTREPEKPTKE
jgi:hypothetical protein